MVISDYDKLMNVAEDYSDKHELFTSEMLYDYLLNTKIKFKKNMNTRRISRLLLSSKNYEKAYHKNNRNYYRRCLKND